MKLHLGCGKRYLPGYKHVDLSVYPHVDWIHPVDYLPMIEDGSVEVIYASHVFEYFSDAEAPAVLAEWYKKLCPRGILRLAVPNFEALVEVYLTYNRIDLISGPIYGYWKVSDALTAKHNALYDKVKLSNVLQDAGFTTVRPWNWREVFTGELAGFDDYSQAYVPHMDKEKGTLISLNLEGVK